MIHYTCDLCGKRIDDDRAERFAVRMEIYPAFDPDRITASDLDEDHLEAVARVLQQEEEADADSDADADCDDGSSPRPDGDPLAAKAFRFDLCANCQRKFVSDPLGRASLRTLNFSAN